MTTPADNPRGMQRIRVLLIVSGAVLVALLAVWMIAGRGGGQPVAAGTESPASTAGSPTAEPSVSSETGKSTGEATKKPSGTATTNGSTLKEMPPVGLDSEADRPDGVVIALKKIESIAGEAKLPGEIAGPALRLTVTIKNGTNSDLSLDSVVVNGYRGAKQIPLEMLTSPGGSPFTGTLKPGEQAEAVYIFAVDGTHRSDVTFTVDATPGQPAAVFRGDAR